MRKLIFLLHCFICLTFSSFAGTNAISHYSSRLWQTDDGLPQNSVQAILQSRDGFLWLGTQEGLARFDGLQFTVINRANTPELPTSSFTALLEAKDGSFWFGSEGNGLTRINRGKVFQYNRANGLAGDTVRCLVQQRDGTIWIGTNEGLTRWKDETLTTFTEKDGLAGKLVRHVYEDREGNVWIATGEGLSRYRDGHFTSFNTQNGLLHNSIRAVLEDHEGSLWIGSHGGLTQLKNGKFTHYKKEAHSENIVSALCEDRAGTLWVGTYGGLNRLIDGKLVAELNHEGASYDLVFTIHEDVEGNIWVGTESGLNRVNTKKFTAFTRQQGLSHNNITSVLEDHAGSLWVGTWGGGLNRLQGNEVTIFNSTNGLGSDFVLALHEDRDGSLWIGTPFDSAGLKKFKDGVFTRYGQKEGLVDPGVSVIYEDSASSLWLGTRNALNRFKEGKFTRYTTADGLGDNIVKTMCQDHEGSLWLGTQRGLTVYKNSTFGWLKNEMAENLIFSIFEDREKNLWLTRSGAGLTKRHNGLRSYAMKDGLPDNDFYEVIDDDAGYLWLTARAGIFRVNKKELSDFDDKKLNRINPGTYGKADGMLAAECSSVAKPSAWKSKDGRLWFATVKGLLSVDPHHLSINQTKPPISITQISTDKNEVKVHPLDSTSGARQRAGDFRFPPGRGELEFHYTALSFSAPEKNLFKYKLEGVDSDWVEAGTRRIAHYNNVKPGDYNFRVQGCNNDGVWNEEGASLAVVLLPHFWQAKWFIGFVTLLAVSFVAGTVRYATWKKVQEKLFHLEQQHVLEKERTRIARDMHDDLGARLSEILLLSSCAIRNKIIPGEIKT
ncbi:MAG: two-component regulator propeller domain-containing protein, partial [Limisphaerales bacterium]